jgi:hypothetical protein
VEAYALDYPVESIAKGMPLRRIACWWSFARCLYHLASRRALWDLATSPTETLVLIPLGHGSTPPKAGRCQESHFACGSRQYLCQLHPAPPSGETYVYIRVEKNNTATLESYQSVQYRRAHIPDSTEGAILLLRKQLLKEDVDICNVFEFVGNT